MSPPTSPLELLPNELLDHIISYLSTEPPSYGQLHHAPSLQLTHSPTKDLKHLTLCSSRLLKLVRPWLFNHVRLNLHEERDFHFFIINSNLSRHVHSLVAMGNDISDRPADPLWWRQVLRYLDPGQMIVIAPPTFIGKTLGTPIMNAHSWEFEIELQTLVLQRECNVRDSHELPSLESCTSLLASRPWTSMSFNESSSLKSYHHYEYFLSTVPSILGEWGANLIRGGRQLFQPQVDLPALLQHLTYFSYTAVFPFFNHSQIVLDAILGMPNLQRLDVRLAPCPGNHATEVEQRGPMDPNDPWMELATSYSLVGYTVNKMKSLTEFRCNDLHVEAIRDDLLSILDNVIGDGGWVHDGQGVWRRN
ncbi:uncharacterized protein N7529_008720 [Penicillium soppii]|uniref:uncharacterized protein n=1 Tax=Penicillium soppii TaxID=69789 RepID=UPI002546908E|nr:uncharacterized protein N7529_008720 [Penicillium soppii]KAJ5861410.1 hypothetical protein N7529_008720 [Penicillium soppii]